MKLVYMGTPDFAVPPLQALAAAGHEIARVVCQPDRPSGRGLTLKPCPVKKAALELGLPVLQPTRMKDPELVRQLGEGAPDLFVVAAYGRILPRAILDVPRLGCLNIHASLLPRLRGAAPIHRAVLEGESTSGVTIMQMDEGLDTGAMLLWQSIALEARETAGSLHDRLCPLGARLIVDALDRIAAGTLTPTPQDGAGATYAAKVDASLCEVDWSAPVASVDRSIRGLTPAPGAYTWLDGKRLKLIEVQPCSPSTPPSHAPGTIIALDPVAGITVTAGDGALRLLGIQLEGKKAMSARDFLAGYRLAPGTILGRARTEGAPRC